MGQARQVADTESESAALTETLMHIWILLFLYVFFFFCVSLSSVCRLLICLPLALSLCHHRHRDYPHYEHVSIARCVRGGERFLQCQQVDQGKGVPTIHPSNQCPIPISDPFPPRDSHSHSQSSGQT